MGTDVLRSVVEGDVVRVRDRFTADSGDSSGRGKKKDIGFRENLDRKGGLRTLRYMLKDRNALFA